nr:Qat anti-phage system associated protein QatB [Aeromicrobium sp. CFBP 8757]
MTPQPDEETSDDPTEESANPDLLLTPLAPPRRFAEARRNIGEFANTSDSVSMRRGLREYTRTGYGGAEGLTARFGGTVRQSERLFNALDPSQSETSERQRLLAATSGAVALLDIVVEIVAPVDGTQDAESSRAAVFEAIAELQNQYPSANILELTAQQRDVLIEEFVAVSVYQRVILDIGDAISAKAPSIQAESSRLQQIRDFIKATVSGAFTEGRIVGLPTTSPDIASRTRDALQRTFQVFKDWTK